MVVDMNNSKTIPAISIVIPTYNLENYIDQTLNSILNQSFKDYEVIVIDDCSTDKTLDVAEKFLPKFDGKLQIHQLKKNSNDDGATPRNFGLKYSRGEYVFFLDGDDLITSDALEKFHNAAEKFQSDVVSVEKFYLFKDRGVIPAQNELVLSNQIRNAVTAPTIEENDLLTRVNLYLNGTVLDYCWSKLIRRDFLIEHRIKFSSTPIRHDSIFAFHCYCLSKYVRIPDVLNLYRQVRDGSATDTVDSISDNKIRKYINSTIIGAKEFYNSMQTIDELKNNSTIQYAVIRRYIKVNLDWLMVRVYRQVPAGKIFQLFIEEFLKDPAGYTPAAAAIFNMANGK